MSGATFNATEVSRYYATRLPQLQQRGRQWRCSCPLHNGKHRSFSIHAENGCWHCFSDCGRGGSLIDFEMEFTNVDFRAAVDSVCSIVGRPVPGRIARDLDQRAWLQERRTAEREMRDAAYFACAARLMIEAELDRLPSDSSERRPWTQLLLAIQDDAHEVFRRVKHVDPESADAWVHAGRRHQKRLQTALARFIHRIVSEDMDRAA